MEKKFNLIPWPLKRFSNNLIDAVRFLSPFTTYIYIYIYIYTWISWVNLLPASFQFHCGETVSLCSIFIKSLDEYE